MNGTDVVVGGIWIAAAINVAGYIVHSYSSTYSQFPEAGSGGKSSQVPTVIPPRVRKTKPGPPPPIPRRVPAPSPKRFPVPPPVIAPKRYAPGVRRPADPVPVPPGVNPDPTYAPGNTTGGGGNGGFDIPTPWGPIHIPGIPSLPKPKFPNMPGLPDVPIPVIP